MFLVKREYFNKTYIIKGLISALFFSAFIYLSHFGIEYKIINTILGLLSLYLVLKIERKSLFYTGFFIGIFWFYWVGNSFEYYGVGYLYPLIVLAFGLGYGVLFFLSAIYDKTYFRAVILFLFSFIHPFGFNWFIPELIFIDSYFPITKEFFALVLISILMFIELKPKLKVLALLPFAFMFFQEKQIELINEPKIDIAMPQLNIPQDFKWQKKNLSNVIEKNLVLIENAILEKKELIILPETVFPILLNEDEFLMEKLFEFSYHIDIVAGSLYLENNQFYNATYYFSKGKYQVAKKVVLVPFGEEIPLPKIFVDLINDIFYNGAEDYKKADKPTDFEIKGIKFRNAICYEATSEEIYQNLGDIRYVIATSNNAWFTPSIEPTLQKLLIKYYAKKYNVMVFHSINKSANYIIKP